jgi:hypothetical protein
MNPLEFLAVVLPTPGHGLYCAAELTKKKEHLFVEHLEDIYPKVNTWVEQKNDTYFALATFDDKGKRKAENAQYVRSLFIDMDGYESKKKAAFALKAFLAETGLDLLGSPYIVGSGGGLHCYWPFTENIEVEEWKPLAENFKRLCKQQKLTIDMTVTADAARVLRIPDTFNFKPKYPEPRPVQLLIEGDTFDFETLKAHVVSLLKTIAPAPVPTQTALSLPGQRPSNAPATATGVKLMENSATSFKKIFQATKAGKGCAQLKHYVENASDDGMEPLWRAWLSIAKPCVDGTKAAIWLSDLHPYPQARMQQKLTEIKGPYACVKFDSENPGLCDQCQFFGKITNPLALGREVMVETEAKEVEVHMPSNSETIKEDVFKVLRPTPPKGYAYGVRGGVFMEKEDEDSEGNKTKRQIMILPYDLFVVDILKHNGEHTVHLLSIRPEGAETITMSQKAIVSKDETVKALANQNVIAAYGSGNDKNLFDYVRASVEQSSTGKAPVKVPANYGWQHDDTYVFAGKIFSKGKPPLTVPMPGLENIVANTKPTGTIEAWRSFMQLLIKKEMFEHLAIMLAGASAPLMRFTGIYGMTYHCGSTESGTGKSLALEAAASVWGHPVHYRTGKSTSPVAMQQRLGLLNSHPLITDELTSKNRANFEWLPEFLLDMTEGRGKERMESGANKERINLSTWMTCAIMSSNTHVVDGLTGGRKHSSEGELRRLLEFILTKTCEWEPHEIEIIKSLQHNYAVAGHIMAQYMVDNVDELKVAVPDAVQQMYKEFGATNDERFWMAGIGAIVYAGVIFNKAGILTVPMKQILNCFKKVVIAMRGNIKASARGAEDVLNAYTREHYGHFIVVRETAGTVLAELGRGGEVDKSTTRSEIMGRVEHGFTPDHVDFYIEEQLLKAYCSSMSFGYADFKRQLAAVYTVSHVAKKNMTARTQGPQMRVSVLKVSCRISDMDDETRDSLSLGAD